MTKSELTKKVNSAYKLDKEIKKLQTKLKKEKNEIMSECRKKTLKEVITSDIRLQVEPKTTYEFDNKKVFKKLSLKNFLASVKIQKTKIMEFISEGDLKKLATEETNEYHCMKFYKLKK